MPARKIIAALVFALTGSVSLSAAAEPQACTLGELTRNVSVVYSDPGQPVPCEVLYEKPTEGIASQSLWQASSEAGYCEARATEFVDKLTGMGWDCATQPPSLSDNEEAE